jgi:PA14 domain
MSFKPTSKYAALGLVLGFGQPLLAGELGKMTRELWLNNAVSAGEFRVSPRCYQAATSVSSVSTFAGSSAPQDIGDQFFARCRALITAPVTGSYTFWVSSDDDAEVFLSPTASKFGRNLLCSLYSAVPVGEFDLYPNQKSAPVQLVAGQKLFIEALYRDWDRGDHMELAWQLPGGVRTAIPATALESFTADPDDGDNDELRDSWEQANGFSITPNSASIPGQLATADPDHDGYSNLEESQLGTNPRVASGLPGSLTLETFQYLPLDTVQDLLYNPAFFSAPSRSEFIFSAETPQDREDYFGARMRGTVKAPVSGIYTFYVAADDKAILWLSNNASQFSKVKIASVDSATAVQEWTKSPTQTSVMIPLVAGQKYYIEAVQTETAGADHLEIGWKLPGATAVTVIPGSALESYAYDPMDPDGDNMPSAWETANGLNPALNEAALDPDGDLIQNGLEFAKGTNPQQKNALAGALLYEKWQNISGYPVKNLTSSPKFLQTPDQRGFVVSAKAYDQQEDSFGSRIRGYLIPQLPNLNSYTFQAIGDDDIELWLSTDEQPWNRVLLAHPDVNTRFMDGGISYSQYSKTLQLMGGKRYYFESLHKNNVNENFCVVNWKINNGPFTPIPSAALSSFIPLATDADDDYLPDAWEIANGLSPNDNGRILAKNGRYGDLDGDGLTNAEEFTAGTRADLADTDGDGVSDFDELRVTKTSALSVDSAPIQAVATIAGGSYSALRPTFPPRPPRSAGFQKRGKPAKIAFVAGWITR